MGLAVSGACVWGADYHRRHGMPQGRRLHAGCTNENAKPSELMAPPSLHAPGAAEQALAPAGQPHAPSIALCSTSPVLLACSVVVKQDLAGQECSRGVCCRSNCAELWVWLEEEERRRELIISSDERGRNSKQFAGTGALHMSERASEHAV